MSHRFAKIAAAIFIAACSISLPAFADEPIPPSPIVKTVLQVDAPQVKAGDSVWAGVTFTIPEHWHIYWQNPGDSGIPTTYAWTLPDGLTAGNIVWPAPQRLEMSGLVNYGYSNQITLPVELTPSKDNIAGNVQVQAKWLVCRDVCIPESATLTAPLVANAGASLALGSARTQVPSVFKGDAIYSATSAGVTLTITQATPWMGVTKATFFPVQDGVINNNNQPTIHVDGTNLQLTFPRSNGELVPTLDGVLQLSLSDGKETIWQIAAANHSPVAQTASTAANNTVPMESTPTSLIVALGLAFLGGLILNVMPCVLPILALKALALAKKAKASRAAAARQGAAYTTGVVVSFLAIAGVMLALKASGSAIGWGFQLQDPIFVGILAVVMILVAANLLGIFELPVLFGSRATGINENSLRGSFLTGALAVLVATPCTAPFMATAIGATLALPTLSALLVFAALGFGMAAPFLLISLWPAAMRLLPKPGVWMNRFKHILAIPMLATAAWLIWVLVQIVTITPMAANGMHEPYDAARLETLRAAGTPVLVDATAVWCLTCKVNERVALHPQEMQDFLQQKQVVQMVADWTMSDPAITAYLASFGRNGVPIYVYYPPHHDPVVLPQLLTPSIVRDIINRQYE